VTTRQARGAAAAAATTMSPAIPLTLNTATFGDRAKSLYLDDKAQVRQPWARRIPKPPSK
jgi:hypothetical protein